jgi:hypothetical protein
MKLRMKKELLLAIVIGLTFGLIITYGIYRARMTLSQPPRTAQSSPTPTASPDSENSANLRIVSPNDESVQSDKAITVAGASLPGSHVVIFINDTEHLTTADTSGNFSIQGTLEAGSNIITIHALDENGKVTVQERTVILVSPSADTQTATGSGEKQN